MKKILSLTLAGAMMLSLAACGTKTETNENKEATDWSYIQDKGVMTIGVTNYPPMNYMDDNGEWTGFDTEFARQLVKN